MSNFTSLLRRAGPRNGRRAGSLLALSAALAMGLFTAPPAAKAQISPDGTITNGNASFGFNVVGAPLTGAGGSANFLYTGISGDQLFEAWWHFRVLGDAAETRMPNPDTKDYTGNVATLTWNDVGTRGLFGAQAVITVADLGSNSATVTLEMTVTNISGADLNLDFFHFADIDVNASAGTDSGTLTSDPCLITITDVQTMHYHGIGVNEFSVGAFGTPSPETLLQDADIDDFSGAGLPFNGDIVTAFQWATQTIGAGGTAEYDVVIALNAVVTPSCGIPTSPFTVDTTSDVDDSDFSAGNFSLREAIRIANSGDTIMFDPSLDGTQIFLNSTLVIDGKDLDIVGPGPFVGGMRGQVGGDTGLALVAPGVFRAAVNDRHFFLNNTVSSFTGMSFFDGLAQGGDGGNGGGGGAAGMGGSFFINLGDVSFNNVVFDGNDALGGNGGAGFLVGGGGGGMGADGSNGDNNTLVGGTGGNGGPLGGAGGGGGVFGPGGVGPGGDAGDADADGIVESESDGAGGGGGNADLGPGGAGGNGGFGGGAGGGSLGAGNGGLGGFGGGGGGGANGFGGPGGLGGAGGLFGGAGGNGTDMFDGGGGGGGGLGGAIFLRAGSLTITSCSFDNNIAAGGLGGLENSARDNGADGQGKGGAIFINFGATLAGSNNNFSANTATDDLGISGDDDNVFNAGVPLAVELESFSATARTKFASVKVEWVTSAEIDLVGFNVFRAEREGRSAEWTLGNAPLNAQLVAGKGSPSRGARYDFVDSLWTQGQERAYFLVDIDLNGRETIHGPAFVRYVDATQLQGEVETLPADEAEAGSGNLNNGRTNR
jgi:hypothetical protein